MSKANASRAEALIAAFKTLLPFDQKTVVEAILPLVYPTHNDERTKTTPGANKGSDEGKWSTWLTLEEAANRMEVNKSTVSKYTSRGSRHGKLIAVGEHHARRIYVYSAAYVDLNKRLSVLEKLARINGDPDLDKAAVLWRQAVNLVYTYHSGNGIDLHAGTYIRLEKLPEDRVLKEFWAAVP